jgi:Domain of unknown function (DUF4932)
MIYAQLVTGLSTGFAFAILAAQPAIQLETLARSETLYQYAAPARAVEATIPAEVDPRVELLSIVFRLIKANEYNQPSSESSYSRAAAAHFGKHVDHEAIQLAARFRQERGIGFDAVASFASHLKDLDSCEFAVPLEPWPKTFERRWNASSAQEFAQALKQFVHDSDFQKFWDEQKPFRSVAEARMKETLARRPMKRWIESFFGVPLQPDSRVRIGLLNGGANYGSSVLYPDGRLVVFPTIGVWNWDSHGLPVFDDRILDTIIHEFCHPFVNPLIDDNLDQLQSAGRKLHLLNRQVMAAQAYGEPRTVLYESLVRASVVQVLALGEGDKTAAAQLKHELSRGFWWTPPLVKSLERYSKNREKFPTLAKFMPELAADLNRTAQNSDAILGQLPKVVDILPKAGSEDLPPEVKLRIEFDRPMDRSSRGLSFEKNGAFEVVSPGRFDDSGRVYSVTLRFQPGAVVQAWINRSGMGLTTESGYAATPQTFEFEIAKDKQARIP